MTSVPDLANLPMIARRFALSGREARLHVARSLKLIGNLQHNGYFPRSRTQALRLCNVIELSLQRATSRAFPGAINVVFLCAGNAPETLFVRDPARRSCVLPNSRTMGKLTSSANDRIHAVGIANVIHMPVGRIKSYFSCTPLLTTGCCFRVFVRLSNIQQRP